MNEHFLDPTIAKLMEEYDSVLILCTKNEGGVTKAAVRRGGNYYASRGLAQEWLDDLRNEELAKAISDNE